MLRLQTKTFGQLSTTELYELLKLRSMVFVVEQNCVYADPDDKDYQALHVLGMHQEKLVAYARLLPQGLSYPEASIGRVVTHPAFRGLQFGRALMQYSITEALRCFETTELVISAQAYLQAFYTQLGFNAHDDPYMEDGIPHIEMWYRSGS